uniref:Phosphocarrier protein HPr (Histidine-containing protein) (Protein H) n=1 Tax=mine drainage metagenome TaxID=410659 RepID=E6QUG8_9ZZZZ
MRQQDVEIINKLGMHARASAKFTQLATQFTSEVWLSRGIRRVNAKSIMGVMMLAAAKGSVVKIEVDGEDEQVAISALADLVTDKFGESE